jgi:thioredoxin-related protein
MKRRQVCLSLLAAALCGACAEPPAPQELITPAGSFQSDAKSLSAPREMFAVVITQHGCEHCELLRRNVLHPVIRRNELDPRIELREVSLNADFTFRDFQGEVISGKKFVSRYDIDITPTVLFLDKAGNSLVEPLVGTGNIEFYSFYLDKKIEAAAKTLSTSR